jgi:hypothetical protein
LDEAIKCEANFARRERADVVDMMICNAQKATVLVALVEAKAQKEA